MEGGVMVFFALGVKKEGVCGRLGVWFFIVASLAGCQTAAWMISGRFGKWKQSELQEQRFE